MLQSFTMVVLLKKIGINRVCISSAYSIKILPGPKSSILGLKFCISFHEREIQLLHSQYALLIIMFM